MIELFRDQIWNFIGVVIGLVGIGITLTLNRRQQKRKDLSYEIISNYPLISIPDGLDKVKILYENKRVRNINIVVMNVFNSGTVPILPDDFIREIAFDFGGQSEILAAEIIHQTPSKLNAKLKEVNVESNSEVIEQLTPNHPANKVVLSPLLLNEGWGVTIKFLVSQFDKINVDGLVVGVKDIEKKTEESIQSKLFTGGSVVIVIFILLLILTSFIPPILVGLGFAQISLTLFEGLAAGFILATFIGWVLGQIQKTRKRVGAHNRKQPVISFTDKTPQQVRADHFRAVFEITGWVFILVVGVSIFIYFLI